MELKKNGMIHMKAIGLMIKTGMKAIGPMMICTTSMSMDTSRRKEKEKERKGKKGKDDDGKRRKTRRWQR